MKEADALACNAKPRKKKFVLDKCSWLDRHFFGEKFSFVRPPRYIAVMSRPQSQQKISSSHLSFTSRQAIVYDLMSTMHDRTGQASYPPQYSQTHLTKVAPPGMQHTGSQPAPYLSYFISRSNGPLVPLIPADELPFNIRLQGVPRVLTFDQAYGMQHVGTASYTGQVFKLENQSGMECNITQPCRSLNPEKHPIEAPYLHPHSHSGGISGDSGRHFMAPDAHVRQALGHQSSPAPAPPVRHQFPERPVTAEPASSTATSWRRQTTEPVDKTQAVIDAIIDSDPAAAARAGYVPKGTPPPSGKIPDSDKKEFCTYWIRTGECDYMQQGCMYKHEMPDRETLTKIGFRTLPRWWQERNAIKLPVAKPMLVGDGRKPHEWLKAREAIVKSSKGSDSGSDADADSDTSDESKKEKKAAFTPKPTSILKRPVPTTKPEPVKSGFEKLEPTMPKVSFTDQRKNSLASSDLIDFKPLLPTPPSSTSSPSPPASRTSSPAANVSTPATATNRAPAALIFNPAIVSKKHTTKVFVPAGESPSHHIADHNSRKRVPRSSPAPSTGTNTGTQRDRQPTAPKPIEKQIEDLHRKQHVRQTQGQGHNKLPQNGGLAASKWAPGNELSRSVTATKSGTKAGEAKAMAGMHGGMKAAVEQSLEGFRPGSARIGGGGNGGKSGGRVRKAAVAPMGAGKKESGAGDGLKVLK